MPDIRDKYSENIFGKKESYFNNEVDSVLHYNLGYLTRRLIED